MAKESQTDMLEHSRAKVELLKLYLDRYLNILAMARGIKAVRLYDLFCGEGIYPNEGRGSPIAILDAIKRCLGTNFIKSADPCRFDCQFNDSKAPKVEMTRAAIETMNYKFSSWVQHTLTNDDYRVALEKIIPEITSARQSKAFVFIDPYGYKDILPSDIKRILDTEKTEVLLFVPLQFMHRFRLKSTPASLHRILGELFGEELPGEGDTFYFLNELKKGWQQHLGEKTFVDVFTIRKNSGTVYALFFFTRHVLGYEKMLEAKWKLDEAEGRGWSFNAQSTGQVSLLGELERNEFADSLEHFIFEKPRSNSEVYMFTLRQGHRPSDATKVLRHLQSIGTIQVKRSDGQALKKGGVFINYDDHTKDPRKVIISKH